MLRSLYLCCICTRQASCVWIRQMHSCYAASWWTQLHRSSQTPCDHLNLTIHGTGTDFPWGVHSQTSQVLGQQMCCPFCGLDALGVHDWGDCEKCWTVRNNHRLTSEVLRPQNRISSESKLHGPVHHTSASQNSKSKWEFEGNMSDSGCRQNQCGCPGWTVRVMKGLTEKWRNQKIKNGCCWLWKVYRLKGVWSIQPYHGVKSSRVLAGLSVLGLFISDTIALSFSLDLFYPF